jgi:ankyrin repeat protein
MKHLLLTTIAAVVLVGCGPKAPDISIHEAAKADNIEVVKYHLAAGVDVNAPDVIKRTPLAYAASEGHKEIVELLIAKSAVFRADKYWSFEELLEVKRQPINGTSGNHNLMHAKTK